MRLGEPAAREGSGAGGMKRGGGSSMESEYILNYRCPECHYLVEEDLLFNTGCPICGWVSPLAAPYELVADDSRNKHIDIVDDEDFVWVVVELPVVDEDGITIDLEGDTLLISAGSLRRIVPLRYGVETDIERTTYRNGVLEIKLKKKKG